MTDFAIVAGKRDAPFAESIRAGLQSSQQRDVSVSESLPQRSDAYVVLLWSAALEAAHAIDVQALIALWSDGHLLVVRRDATPLPLGMRDLPSLPPDRSAGDICAAISKPDSSLRASTPSPAAIMLAVLAVGMLVLGGSYYYLTAAQREIQAELTARLETAAKASADLKLAQTKQLEALKEVEARRLAQAVALNSGDASKIRETEEATKRAEAEAAKQAELVRQREAASAKAREDAKRTADSAKQASAEKAKAEQKAEVAAVAPKAEAPKTEAPKAAPVAKAEPAPKAEPARTAEPDAPRAMTRSEREAQRDAEAAAKAIGKPAEQVAVLSPSVSAPSGATPSAAAAPEATAAKAGVPETEAMYQQALVMERDGKTADAVRIYRRAARAGNGKAAKRLGDIFDRGAAGVSRDYAESLQWYQTARDLGETVEIAGRRESTGVPEMAAESRPIPKSAPAPMRDVPKAAAPVPASSVPRVPAASIPEARKAVPVEAKVDVDAEELLVRAIGAQNSGRNEEALRLFKEAAGESGIAAGLAAKRLAEAYNWGLLGVERYYLDALKYDEIARKNGVMSAGRGGGSIEEGRREQEVADRVTRAVAERYGTTQAPLPRLQTADEAAAFWAKARAHGRSELAYAAVLFLAVLGIGVLLWRRYGTRRVPQNVLPSATAPQLQPAGRHAAQLPVDAATLFVSYSHKDKKRVEPIVSLMEEMGRRVWMDRTDITGQAGWAGQIVRAIRECRAVVLMASPNSFSSDQVVRELYLAMNHKKTIVPIEIEPADLPDELQYILAPFQHHRLSGSETREVLGRALAAV